MMLADVEHPEDGPLDRRARDRVAAGLPWLVVLGGAIFAGYLVLQIPAEVFFSGDGGLKALLARQFASGRLAFDLRLEADDWVGGLWDAGYYPYEPPFVYPLNHRYYLAYPVTFPLLTAPFYALLGFRGLYVIPVLSLAAVWIIFHRLSGRLEMGPIERACSLAALVFATPLTLYGAMYWEHTLAAALTFAGLAATIDGRSGSRPMGRHGAGGALVGLAAWFRPECVCVGVAAALTGAALCRERAGLRRWVRFGVGMAAALTPFLLLNLRVYGHPLGAHSFELIEAVTASTHPARAVDQLRSLNVSLVLYAPTVVFALGLTLPALLRRRGGQTRTMAYLGGIVLISSLLIPVSVPTDGGTQWGPRFLLCGVPVLSLLCGLILTDSRRRGARLEWWTVLGLFVLIASVGAWRNTGIGSDVLTAGYRERVAPALDFLRSRNEAIVVVSHTFVAQELEAVIGEKTLFLSRDPQDWPPLAAALHARGYDRFLFLLAVYDGHPIDSQFAIRGNGTAIEARFIRPCGYHYFAYACTIKCLGGGSF